MKAKGIILILLGVAGATFVYYYDIIAGKPVNDITGPKSLAAFVLSAIFIVVGLSFISKKISQKVDSTQE